MSICLSGVATALLSDGLTVYADIFFAINFSMDLVIFLVLSRIFCRRVRLSSALAASILTALLPIVQMALPGNETVSFIIYCVNSLLACFIAFGAVGFIKLLLSFASFISVSALVSFLLTKLFLALGRPTLSGFESTSGGIIPLAVCLFSSVVAYLFSFVRRRLRNRKYRLKASLCVISDKENIEMSAYCDSGNLLREPMGGLPVIITGKEKMKSIVPKSLHGVFFSSVGYLGETSLSDAKRVRIIPIMPVGSESARILFGYVPDKILLDGAEVSACIALDTANSSFGGCEALLPRSLMKDIK